MSSLPLMARPPAESMNLASPLDADSLQIAAKPLIIACRGDVDLQKP